MKRLLLIFMLVGCGTAAQAESVILTPVKPASTRVTVIITAPPTTVKTPPPFNMGDFIVQQRKLHGKCGEFHDLAISVGWTEEQWPDLSRIVHRESRCDVRAHNKTDPMSGSRGLMQINGYWCSSVKYNPSGWLQAKGILTTCEDLYDPITNLRAGLAMWNYNDQRGKYGWSPWNL